MYVGLTKASSRNTQSHWVQVSGVCILFSYATAIAVQYDGQRVRRKNHWGSTTGRHINEAEVRTWPVVDDVLFDQKMDEFVYQAIADRVASRLTN